MDLRIGIGFDSHTFDPRKTLFLGGVRIEGFPGLKGHSDGDVILHALTDAILGAIGAGDIGTFFSDSDPRWKGAPSRIFLEKALSEMESKGFKILNTDIVYIAEKPKISDFRGKIIKNLSELMGIEPEKVFIKGKRNEGFESSDSAVCVATVLMSRSDEG